MHSVLHDALDSFELVYLDDILVFSASEEEHERHLRWVSIGWSSISCLPRGKSVCLESPMLDT